MNKVIYQLIVSLLISSCQAQEHNLGLYLNKGQVYTQRMVSETVLILPPINGQQIKSSFVISSTSKYEVIGINDTIYEIEIRYESLGMKFSSSDKTVEFGSEKKDNEILSRVLSTMTNKPFYWRISKHGRISQLNNYQSIFSNMFDSIPNLDEAQKKQVLKQVSESFGEKAFLNVWNVNSIIFPEHPISKGNKWTTYTVTDSKTPLKIETEYQLKNVKKESLKITGHSIIRSDENNNTIQLDGLKASYITKGTITSDYNIDRASGWIKTGIISQSSQLIAIPNDKSKIASDSLIISSMKTKTTITMLNWP